MRRKNRKGRAEDRVCVKKEMKMTNRMLILNKNRILTSRCSMFLMKKKSNTDRNYNCMEI